MLQHIGLSIIEPAEIQNFYESVLHFRQLKQFTLDSEDVLHSIFSIDRQTEVFMLEQQDLKLELFIDPKGERGRYPHLCLAYDNPEEVFGSCPSIRIQKMDQKVPTVSPISPGQKREHV